MYKISKSERLSSKASIEKLFSESNSFKTSFFRVLWNEHNKIEKGGCRVLFIVSKRNIRLATQRNYIRRRIKEAYRINKFGLNYKLKEKNKLIDIAIIYNHKESMSFNLINEKIKLILNRLENNL